jgi:uncharacterized YccA/Bax inhibitor family protein
MNCQYASPAARRYHRRFIPTVIAYVLILIAVAWYVPRFHPPSPLTYFLAILPAIPIIGIVAIVGFYLAEEQDEFQRTVLIQSMLWSIGLTLSTTTVWGFLEIFAAIPHFQPYLAFPLFWFFVGLATPILKWRYR